jgi:ATP-dependent RNA helicase SUPV3L1/SUV3
MTTSVAEAGEVIVEGEHLGRVEGFRFVPDSTEGQTDQKAVLSAALRALRENLPARLQAFTSAPDGELVFDSQLRVCWGGGPIARLLPSGDVLAPKVEALPSDLLDGPAREEVRKRAATWVETRIRLGLSELMDARATLEQLPPGARGIVFQLCEHLGILPRRPIEQQMTELSEDDRKALAKLGVRVGVYSLYFPSMLKPVPIRLRAGLWMVAHSRDSIPPLPAEGRTSMDLPQGAERDFYGAIGYVPLGGHAIRADMVERLAAMARQAVRESRENARRAQQEKERKPEDRKAKAAPSPAAPPAPSTSIPASADEISEWAIVAAAFGESEPEPAPAPEMTAAEATPETTPAEPTAYATEETPPEHAEEAPAEEAKAEERAGEETTGEETTGEEPAPVMAEAPADGEAKTGEAAEASEPTPAEAAAAEPATSEAGPALPRPLPPGWFRATPQMMSLVGCSEPEMADVLRGLGYRVHPPSDEHGPLHAFSVKPRFVREREEQRARQRQQERDRRDQRRRERPERPNERQFFADAPRRDRPQGQGQGPRPERQDGPRGPRQDGPRQDRRDDRPPRDDRRGPRGPRRDADGPALRLYATTEKKGDASDSPFAKLLELKLGGKK